MSDRNTSTRNTRSNNTKRRAYVSDEVMKGLQTLFSWKQFYTGNCHVSVVGTPNKAASKKIDGEIADYKEENGLF